MLFGTLYTKLEHKSVFWFSTWHKSQVLIRVLVFAEGGQNREKENKWLSRKPIRHSLPYVSAMTLIESPSDQEMQKANAKF
jgi:hypothetical protein